MKTLKVMLLTFLGIGFAIFLAYTFLFKTLTGYTVKDGVMVYKYVDNANWKRTYKVVPGVDIVSFKTFGFSRVYAKDKNHVYLSGVKIVEADPVTFKIIEATYQYARDENNLYAGYRKIGEDPDNFELLGAGFGRDRFNAYYQGSAIAFADGASFELLDEKGHWAKDKNYMFSFGKVLKGSHSSTFELIEFNFYKDKYQIYCGSKIIKEADYDTFEVLADRYAKDMKHVYYAGRVIEEADPATFEIISSTNGDYFAQDKSNKYWFGRVTPSFPDRIKTP